LTHRLATKASLLITEPAPESRRIVDIRVDATSYKDAASRIIQWASESASKYVCVAAVNNVMEAHDVDEFRRAMNDADLVTPDGMPLVWGLRALGVRQATRVYGPDLTPAVLEAAAAAGIAVGFYGGTPEVLEALQRTVRARWPGLRIAYAFSPPFVPLSDVEQASIVHDMNASGVGILFVGLGCPKQELWMAQHRGHIDAVMLGVGAAFDFLAGKKKQAPLFMQRSGTEWLFRLFAEPNRLWKRYLLQNPRFIALFGAQLIRAKRTGSN
jgi:N-acetylglucosaminyldiphosphoundecaprenol N-acetyl-beta-D-mannosaminyltransferase